MTAQDDAEEIRNIQYEKAHDISGGRNAGLLGGLGNALRHQGLQQSTFTTGTGSMDKAAIIDQSNEMRKLQEQFKQAIDKPDTLLREIADVLKNEVQRTSDENKELRTHIRALEDRLLKAVDLAHSLMEKFGAREEKLREHIPIGESESNDQ